MTSGFSLVFGLIQLGTGGFRSLFFCFFFFCFFVVFFLFFNIYNSLGKQQTTSLVISLSSRNDRILHFMRIVNYLDGLHEVSNPVSIDVF